MSSMDKYQKAMLRAYWLPLLLFFVLPCSGILFAVENPSLAEVAVFLLPFPITIFVSGYVLAPYFGPKTIKHKYQSFLMAGICLLIALVVFLGANGGISSEPLSFSIFLVI